jgi:hypothetical protein
VSALVADITAHLRYAMDANSTLMTGPGSGGVPSRPTPFRYCFFDNRFDKGPKPDEYESFDGWAADLAKAGHQRRAKKDGIAFSPVTYRPDATRSLRAVDLCYGIGLDIEHVTPERVAQLFQTLTDGGIRHFAYTTHSHAPAAPRWRAVIPLTQPVPAALYPRIWEQVVEVVGADAVDEQTKDASRLFYLPSAPEGGEAQILNVPGDALDPLVMLDLTPEQLENVHAAAVVPVRMANLPISITTGLVEKTDALAQKPRPTPAEILARARASANPRWKSALGKLEKHEAYALPGERDSVTYGLAATLSWVAPEADPEDIVAMFDGSLAAMALHVDPTNPPPVRATVEEKVRRALNDARNSHYQTHNEIFPEATSGAGGLDADASGMHPGLMRTAGFTPAELSALAARQNCTVDEFKKQFLIIESPNGFSVVGPDGNYLDPLPADAVMRALSRDWAPLINCRAVDLWKPVTNKNGAVSHRRKSINELMDAHGSVARHVSAEMGRRVTVYVRETQTLIEAACVLRDDLVAEFNPQIDQWLKLLAGELYGSFQDWLAVVMLTDRPTAVVSLWGPPATGKSMAAEGCAKLWGRNAVPTPFDEATGAFNAGIRECPLLLADEYLGARRNDSKALRAIVAKSSHRINDKNKSIVSLQGCVRAILAANNPDVLGLSGEDLTEDDVEAVESRVLEIKAQPEAAEYLRSIGGRATTEAWVAGDGIAKHVLWLQQNRRVQHGHRFLVGGQSPALARMLKGRDPAVSALLEVLVRCAKDPQAASRMGRPLDVRFGGGEYWVTREFIDASWSVFAGQRAERPPAKNLGVALKRVTKRTTRPAAGDGNRRRYYVLDTEFLSKWAEESGLATGDELQAIFDTENKAKP